MDKYRIISRGSTSNKLVVYNIEKRGWFSWKKIYRIENQFKDLVTFTSFEEAEKYIREVYCRMDGQISQPCPNEFHYERYDYHFC